MGKRKDNPDLVENLIDGLWKMSPDEFEDKYNSLNKNDKSRVSAEINKMEKSFLSSDDDDW